MKTLISISTLAVVFFLSHASSAAEPVDAFCFYVRPKAAKNDSMFTSYDYFINGEKVAWADLLKKIENGVRDGRNGLKVSVVMSSQCSFDTMSNLHGMFGKVGGIQERFFIADVSRPYARELTATWSDFVPLPGSVIPGKK